MSDSKPRPIPRVLAIAGSDPSGGAGIEADIKVITAHGCYGMTAITALTAQNTEGVRGIHIVPPEFLRNSLEAVLDDIGADVIKTGMLAGKESIKVVAETLEKYGIKRTVVDPVMVSTSGSELLPPSAVISFIENIFPHVYLLTPNILEALLLLKYLGTDIPKINSVSTMVEVAKALQAHGPKNVLLKGGHVPFRKTESQYYLAESDEQKEVVVDVLVNGTELVLIENPYINTKNTHGTGCSLASSIASNLARGFNLEDAVRSSCNYVSAAIKTSIPNLGKGNGPINHIHSNYILPFAPGHFVEYLLSHPKIKDHWRDYTHHEFVNQLGAGTLDKESFKHYLIQDYLFLIQFARANSLAGYKNSHIDEIAKSASIVLHIQNEMKLHISYCASFGISREQMEAATESLVCTAYTRFVLDIGASQGLVALKVATAPCLIGYRDIAVRIKEEYSDGKEENIYWKWVENYASKDYRNAYDDGRKMLEEHAVKQSVQDIEELVEIFAKSTKLEKEFWTMGLERK